MNSLRWTMAAACLALCACGSATSDTDGGTGGSRAQGDAGLAAGGGAGGGTGGASGGGGPTTVKSGYIQLTQSAATFSGMTFYSGLASAGFLTVTGGTGGAPGTCTTQTSGPCSSMHCVQPDGGTRPDSGVTVTTDLAGTITITGTMADGGLTLVPEAGNAYTTVTTSTQLWAAGATLTASATGDTVPAFSGKSLTAPADLTVTAPACASFSCGTIPRTSALTVTWSGATAGSSVVVSLGSNAGGTAGSVTCTFDGSAGSGTVPAALMADLVAGSGSMAVMPTAKSSFKAGDYDVTLTASGTGALGTATIQ